jgi:hypothetical protein
VTAGDDGADGDPDAVPDAARLAGAPALLLAAGDAEPAKPAEAGVVLAASLAELLAAGWLNGRATTSTAATPITSSGTRINKAVEERERFPSCRRGG